MMAFQNTARLACPPSFQFTTPGRHSPAPYGVRGVDFVRSEPPSGDLTLVITIDGDGAIDIDGIVRAAIAAAEGRS